MGYESGHSLIRETVRQGVRSTRRRIGNAAPGRSRSRRRSSWTCSRLILSIVQGHTPHAFHAALPKLFHGHFVIFRPDDVDLDISGLHLECDHPQHHVVRTSYTRPASFRIVLDVCHERVSLVPAFRTAYFRQFILRCITARTPFRSSAFCSSVWACKIFLKSRTICEVVWNRRLSSGVLNQFTGLS
jgi:hypothetical protein